MPYFVNTATGQTVDQAAACYPNSRKPKPGFHEVLADGERAGFDVSIYTMDRAATSSGMFITDAAHRQQVLDTLRKGRYDLAPGAAITGDEGANSRSTPRTVPAGTARGGRPLIDAMRAARYR